LPESRALKNNFRPRRDVLDLVDPIIARGAPVQANRTLMRLRALFNWAIEKIASLRHQSPASS
jgi:hypothetical protein